MEGKKLKWTGGKLNGVEWKKIRWSGLEGIKMRKRKKKLNGVDSGKLNGKQGNETEWRGVEGNELE